MRLLALRVADWEVLAIMITVSCSPHVRSFMSPSNSFNIRALAYWASNLIYALFHLVEKLFSRS